MADEVRTTGESGRRSGRPRLRVEEAGGGDPVVLVHGSWDDRHVWDPVREGLASRFRVVSYDRRGHTDSPDGPQPGVRRDDEEDLAGLIEDLGLAPAHVVGNSFGASIALGLAARRTELFRSLCIHEPPLLSLAADDEGVPEMGQAVSGVVELIERGQVETAARAFVEEALGAGAWEAMSPQERATTVANAPTFAGEQRDPAWADIDLDALGAIDAPVLITQGDQSPPFFSTVVAQLEAAMGTARVRTLPGAGHVPHQTHPAEYATVVSEFAAATRDCADPGHPLPVSGRR